MSKGIVTYFPNMWPGEGFIWGLHYIHCICSFLFSFMKEAKEKKKERKRQQKVERE